VDTGDHFRGANKVIRYPGREPLDVAMTNHTGAGISLADATEIAGDTDPTPRPRVAGAQGAAGGLGLALAGAAAVFAIELARGGRW
jgi:hypothetical protein